MITDIEFIQDIRGFLMERSERQIILLVDGNVHKLYEPLLEEFDLIVVPPGESSKNIALIEELSGMLVDSGCQRDSLLVGVGGGVVTDIAGFVASVYMRGMSFGLVPTTLLGMCDAAIGGKNGVNAAGIKNLIGTIRQPDFIAVDTAFISTLPEAEFRNGMAEVIKHAFICGNDFVHFLKDSVSSILDKNPETLRRMIQLSANAKVVIVSQDINDNDQRHLLNLGHTIGHALESLTGNPHGECVAAGMNMEARIAVSLKLCEEHIVGMIRELSLSFGLPEHIDFNAQELMKYIAGDKKKRENHIRFIVPYAPGDCRIVKIDESVLFSQLKKLSYE
jgi:3-dehydroquinate synthase